MSLGHAAAWTASGVRETFFDFFKSKEHVFFPPSPTIPFNDFQRLFTNAAMNQFRPIFSGTVDHDSEMAKLKRVYTSQPCIRIGDLADVGRDSYHHTLFEQLANFSFGDYSKTEAIAYAWELLTLVYKLPTDRLYVTYFEGDPNHDLAADQETRRIWLHLGIPDDHIIPGNAKDNFWEMDAKGSPGPCGPGTEIHFDLIGGRHAAHLVNIGDPSVIEFWNIVFVQFNREDNGTLRSLPTVHVDAAIGFERLVSIVQGRQSNYDTDIFTPIFDKICEITGVRPYQGKFGQDDRDGIDTAYRIVADHMRALTFAIADGGKPGDDGRDFVLRLLFERGLQFAEKKLQASVGDQCFFSSLLPVLLGQMGNVYPKLKESAADIKKVMDTEEHRLASVFNSGNQHSEDSVRVRSSAKRIDYPDEVWHPSEVHGSDVDVTQILVEDAGATMNKCDKLRTVFRLGW